MAQVIINNSHINSFQGCSNLQYLITYSMQIQREEEGWEIWSHAVISSSQQVDTMEVVPNSNNSHFRAEMSIDKQY